MLINLADRVDFEKEDAIVTERMSNAEQKIAATKGEREGEEEEEKKKDSENKSQNP